MVKTLSLTLRAISSANKALACLFFISTPMLGIASCKIGPKEDVRRWDRQDAFVSAAIEGDVNKMRALLVEGVDVNGHAGFASHYMHPALIQAAANDHIQVIQFLLANGADVNVRGRDNLTPLMAASDAGHQEIVRLLISNGADVNAVNSSGKSALIFASDPRDPHPEVVKLLQRAGAN